MRAPPRHSILFDGCPPSPISVKFISLVATNATARHSIFLNKKSPNGDFLLTKIGGGPGRT